MALYQSCSIEDPSLHYDSDLAMGDPHNRYVHTCGAHGRQTEPATTARDIRISGPTFMQSWFMVHT